MRAVIAAAPQGTSYAAYFKAELSNDFSAIRHTLASANLGVPGVDKRLLMQAQALLNVAESMLADSFPQSST